MYFNHAEKIGIKKYTLRQEANYNYIQPDNFNTANRTGVMLGFGSIAMTQIIFFNVDSGCDTSSFLYIKL